ncbi:MAG: pilus assembly protein [Planctomycetes bacterium]|nr:pilus assembly protein [Planctomycetota bacterium]
MITVEVNASDTTPSDGGRTAFSKCRRASRRTGVAAVEFALVAPVFFVLVFGMIEFGRMVMVQQILTNASREGARRAVLDAATNANVTTVVNDYLTSASISGATVTVTPSTPSSAAFGDPVTVVVSVPFTSVSWMPSPWFLGSTTLSATTVMRREGGI